MGTIWSLGGLLPEHHTTLDSNLDKVSHALFITKNMKLFANKDDFPSIVSETSNRGNTCYF